MGDAIEYDSDGDSSIDALAFIHGRSDSQTYTVKDKEGNTPTAVTGDNDWAIYRAYTSLNKWQLQDENDTIDDAVENFDISRDLVGNGTIMYVACYADADDTNKVPIQGWNTGSSNYIKIYTPYLTSEVGATQRHLGTWASGGYKIVDSATYSQGVIYINNDYVRIEGLRVENTADKSNQTKGIVNRNSGGGETHISHNIVRSTGSGSGNYSAAGIYNTNDSTGTLKVWNNIVYDFGGGIVIEWLAGTNNFAIYNNTIINSDAVGIEFDDHSSGYFRIANNLVQDSSGYNYYFAGGAGSIDYSATNLSQDDTSPDGASFQNKTVTFAGAADFHLDSSDTNAKDQGTDLSSDPNLSFSDDIDGDDREAADWDIGADEYVAASNSAPTAPTTPYSNDTTAQSGQTNPTGITDTTPAFSAIYNDPDSGDVANKYRVEVNTASDFGGTVMWDSGAGGTSMTDTTAGNRCPDIIYAGSALSNSTTYYWRITFWDDDDTEGTVSATQNFTTGTITSCSSVVLNALYEGTTQIAASDYIATVDITDVDMSKSFLVFSAAVDDNRPQCTQIRGNLYDAGSGDIKMDFERYESTCPVADIRYYVAEFSSGVSVQRGTKTTLSADTINVPLSPTVDTGKSFPLISGFVSSTIHNGNDFIEAEITANNNLQLRKNTGDGTAKVDWQVIEYGCSAVQKNTISGWTTGSKTDVLSPTVDLSKSWLIYSYKTDSGGDATMAENMVRGRITAVNELTFDRDDTGSTIDLTWYLVEFTDDTTIKYGTEDFAAGDSQENVTLSPSVSLASTLALGGMYMRGGKSAHDSDDNPGYGWFTFDLTADDNLQITRNASAGAAADVGWFVIDFNPPTTLYRSVGTAAADLNTGSRTVEISGSTATFSGSMPDNIGVGDVLVYDNGSAQLAFIHGRSSATVFTVKDKDGGAPAAAPAGTAVGVYRAYTSLSNWQSQTENTNITEPAEDDVNPSTDLVTANTIMMVACYTGASIDNDYVIIDNWTTGPANYIKIFTPVSSSEVGTSQRHDGTAGTGYSLITSGLEVGISIRVEYVRVEGLEISSYYPPIDLREMSGPSEIRASHCLLHGLDSGYDEWANAIYVNDTDVVLYAWNNIGYNLGYGISTDASNEIYAYNNTFIDLLHYAVAIGSGTCYAKNNIAANSVEGNYFAWNSGSFHSSSDYNWSDDTTDTGGTNDINSSDPGWNDVTFANESTDNFHLASTDSGAKNLGTDLSGDASLAFADDIDGGTRSGIWDIGADEYGASPVTTLYRSVGITATNLNTSPHTVEISGSTATFSGDMPTLVGVGDVLAYNNGSNRIAFIYGRTSATVFTVKDKDGGTPAAASAGTAVGVYRAYTSLGNWESQTENANITEPAEDDVNPSTDLSAANTILMVACYADGAETTGSEVNISGWTTGAGNYIRIFTPTGTDEVGASQRHSGSAGTGFVMKPNTSSPGEYFSVIEIQEDYVRIEGIEIDGTTITNGQSVSGIQTNNISAASDIRIDKCLIHDITSTTGANYPFAVGIKVDDGSTRITNNIIYDMRNTSADADAFAKGMRLDGGAAESQNVYNNTIYNVNSSGSAGTIAGIHAISGTITATNNYVGGTSGGASAVDFTGTLTQSNNISSDATASGTGSLTNRSATDNPNPGAGDWVVFANLTAGSENFHLQDAAENDALNTGANLSGTFSDDIDGDVRPSGANTWDIGADESDGSCNDSFGYAKSITIDRTKITNPAGTLPIAFDAVSSSQTADAGAGSLSWSHTVGAGSERLLVVGVSIRNNTGQTVSSVTYNSIGLTYLNSQSNGTNARVEMWYLKESNFPGTPGAYTVEVTLSASARCRGSGHLLFQRGSDHPLWHLCLQYRDQQSFSKSRRDGHQCIREVVVAVFAKTHSYGATKGVSNHQVERWNQATADATAANNIMGAGALATGSGPSVGVSWQLDDSTTQYWAIGGVAIKPTSNAPPQITTLTDFPLLYSVTDTDLRDNVTSANGWDIIFRALDDTTCGGAGLAPCTLDHEIEKYDSGTGQAGGLGQTAFGQRGGSRFRYGHLYLLWQQLHHRFAGKQKRRVGL